MAERLSLSRTTVNLTVILIRKRGQLSNVGFAHNAACNSGYQLQTTGLLPRLHCERRVLRCAATQIVRRATGMVDEGGIGRKTLLMRIIGRRGWLRTLRRHARRKNAAAVLLTPP